MWPHLSTDLALLHCMWPWLHTACIYLKCSFTYMHDEVFHFSCRVDWWRLPMQHAFNPWQLVKHLQPLLIIYSSSWTLQHKIQKICKSFIFHGVCESIHESVFDRSKCSVYIWYTSVWSPSNLQADAAFIIELGCTSKVLERFKNDRIIVKTWLAWCPKPDYHGSAALYAINRHSNICTRASQGLRSSGP